MTAYNLKRFVMIVLMLPMFVFWGGCAPELLSAVGGFVLGRLTAPSVTTESCTLNGEPVDCSTIQ